MRSPKYQTLPAQALGNLVDNALRHGGGTVVLGAAARGGWVEFVVRDHGAGFPPGFLARAFERFSRADPSRHGEGAGLGLTIVMRIAEAHGGTAAASAGPDGGAVVSVCLPVPDRSGHVVQAGATSSA